MLGIGNRAVSRCLYVCLPPRPRRVWLLDFTTLVEQRVFQTFGSRRLLCGLVSSSRDLVGRWATVVCNVDKAALPFFTGRFVESDLLCWLSCSARVFGPTRGVVEWQHRRAVKELL